MVEAWPSWSEDGERNVLQLTLVNSTVLIAWAEGSPRGFVREGWQYLGARADGWIGTGGRLSLILPRECFLSFATMTWGYWIPLWIPLSLAGVPTLLLFWRDRHGRIPPGYCQRCGYDLTGNLSGICPECGTAIPKQEERSEPITESPKD